MIRGNKYVCATCGKTFTYCPKCEITSPNFDAERYCCADHQKIFEILSKNGCGLATAEETLKALENYDLNGLTESVKTHIDSLKPAKADEVKEHETVKKHNFRSQE